MPVPDVTFNSPPPPLPPRRQTSDLDVEVADGAGDEEYLDLLRKHLPRLVDRVCPDLIFYQVCFVSCVYIYVCVCSCTCVFARLWACSEDACMRACVCVLARVLCDVGECT